MQLKLYEIRQDYLDVLQQANEIAEQNEGAIPDDLAERLGALEDELTEKLKNCGHAYKNYLAEAEAIRAEEIALSTRRKRAEDRAEWLKGYIASCLIPGQKIAMPTLEIGWRESSAIKIGDGAAVPRQYCRVIPEVVEPDKLALKVALKAGVIIAGVSVEKRQNVVIK